MDFFHNHPCRPEICNDVRDGLLRNAFRLSQAAHCALPAVQVIRENYVHDDALIERPVFATVLAYAPQDIAPRLRN